MEAIEALFGGVINSENTPLAGHPVSRSVRE